MGNPIGQVVVPSFPGRTVAVTPDDATRFAPSVLIIRGAGRADCIPAIPSGAVAIPWTTTAENYVVPGLYVGVNATNLTASDIVRVQVSE